MYEYEVNCSFTPGGGNSQKVKVTLLTQVSSNFATRDLSEAVERQFGKKPIVNSYNFLGKKS